MDDVAFAAGSSSASMDAFASSSTAPTDASHGWQKVVPRKPRKHAAPSAAPAHAAPDLAKSNVFEGVDKRSQERHRAIRAARDAADEADGSIAAWGARSDDDEYGSDSDEAAKPQPEEVKKPKKPKVKKPKVSIADAAALIDAENLAAHLIEVSVSTSPHFLPASP
jgi:hypothetical protein